MKKLIALGILFSLIMFTATACTFELRGTDMPLEMGESAGIKPQDNYAKCSQDKNEEWCTLYRFEQNGLWGFRDAYDNTIIEPQYRGAHWFSEGLAFVMGVEGREYQTGFIDLSGTLVIPLPTARAAGRFSEGFASVSIRDWDWDNEVPRTSVPGPYIFIDRTGQDIFDQEFLSARPFNEGFARVTLFNARDVFIDTVGTNAFDMEFLLAGCFVDGYANVKLLDGAYTHIDREGNVVDKGGW